MIKDKYGNKYYKVALHVHTTRSDGRRTPEEAALEYKSMGYDAIAITDHWVFSDDKELSGALMISGCEYNVGRGNTIEGEMHILGIGMKKMPKLTKGESTRSEVVDGIVDAGGIAVLAHPAWSLNTPSDALALPKITMTEIYNAVSESHESERAYSDYFIDLMANEGKYYGILATDDAHYYDGSDNGRGFVMVRADELSEEAILDALRRGDFYASQGPELYAKIEDNRLIIDCSPAEMIAVFSNKAWARDRIKREPDATHFEYEIRPEDAWVRCAVRDSLGRYAYSRIFPIK